jgi:hypothetical protein
VARSERINMFDKSKMASQRIATCGVFLIFSGYFFYHISLVYMNFPRILGGYFSPLVVFFATLVVLRQVFNKHTILKSEDLSVYLLILFMFGLTFIYYFFDHEINSEYDYSKNISISLLVFLGSYIIIKNANLKSNIFLKFSLPLLLIQCISIIYIGISQGQFVLTTINEDETLKVSGYQQIGMILVFQLGLLMSLTKINIRFMIFLLGLVALFFNGARSEFVAFFIAGAIMIASSLNRRHAFLVYIFLVIAILFFFSQSLIIEQTETRTTTIFQIFDQTSYIARSEMTAFALQCIQNSPFLGCYGKDLSMGEGAYSHNILSAWQTYGIVVFISIISIFVFKAFSVLRIKQNNSSIKNFATYYIVISIFMMLFSKHFLDIVFSISFALMSQVEYFLKKKNRTF